MLDNFTGFVLLNVVVYLPVVTAVACLVWPQVGQVKNVAFAGAALTLLVSLALLVGYPFGAASAEPGAPINVQFFERYSWLTQLNINYTMGVDGISLLLVILTTLLSAISVLISFTPIT